MFRKIKAGQYKFLSPYWDPISQARDALSRASDCDPALCASPLDGAAFSPRASFTSCQALLTLLPASAAPGRAPSAPRRFYLHARTPLITTPPHTHTHTRTP
eukprot:3490212-Pleurochrysis_carterae.AAC.2